MNKKDYFYENEKVYEIFCGIINEGINHKRKYTAFGLLMSILIVVITSMVFTLNYVEPGKRLNVFSISLGLIGLASFIGLFIFMIKEDNRKYRYFNIQEESLKDGLKVRTLSKITYHNNRNDEYDDKLINDDILSGKDINKDIRILDFHINKAKETINEKIVQPLFLRGSVAFFIFFIGMGLQIAIVFFQFYQKLDSLFLSISILIMLVSIAIYSLFYMISSFYKDINNRKIATIKFMIKHLEIIKLKRLHNPQKSILNKIVNIIYENRNK